MTKRFARRVLNGMALCLVAGATGAVAQHDPLFPIVENGKWGLIDVSGRVVLKPVFEAVAPYQSELASMLSGASTSTLDFIALSDVWTHRKPVRTDRIGVRLNGKWGYADRNGTIVVEPRFDALDGFTYGVGREGLIPVMIGDRWGDADPDGRLAIAAELEKPFPFVNGLALAQRNDQ